MAPRDTEQDLLYEDPGLARFYDLDNGLGGADHDTCAGLAAAAASVLDLGCGTGQLAVRLADERQVVGVDPAEAMLAVARGRPGGDRVTWVEARAQDLALDRRFDLVLLTGHAFQVFLSEADQRAALSAIARHLSPGGRFIFDTRNPAREAWRAWTPETSARDFLDPQLGAVEAWNDAVLDPETGIVTYQTHYGIVATGRTFSASSRIRFLPCETLAALIEEAGLIVDTWLGDWNGNPYREDSKEIIPIGRLAGC